jgi:uncharacterized protein (TIGR01777 family)
MMVGMRIVMAGSSGFLGTRLRTHLAAEGHDVVRLVRREPTAPDQVRWWPEQGVVDTDLLLSADAVVNLSGAGVQDKRWNEAYKQVLRASRIEPTRTLARAIAELPDERQPALISQSGVNFYGDRGDEILNEDSLPGEGFLSELAIAWEASTAKAEDAGARVVKLRTGVPLDKSGGLLRAMLLPFRLGVGGKLAGGHTWMTPMSMLDWLGVVTFLLERDDIAGPVNVVGPRPVRNAELTAALGRALHRPTIAPIPGFAIRALYGGVADDFLTSHRAVPRVLTEAGYQFQHPDVDAMLRAAL